MYTGIIKFFHARNFYGFIRPDSKDADVFFHGSELPVEYRGAISEGTRVRYELAERKGKKVARNIVVAGGAQ